MVRGARLMAALALVLAPILPIGPQAQATGPAVDNVATCADLATLGTNPSAAGDTINLIADLDCTGVGFTAIFSGGFTGTFDGHDHSISHLTINQPGNYDVGLFSNTNGATIQNLNLVSGSVAGSNAAGGLIGLAQNTTVKHVTSAVNVSSAGDQVGGLIGLVQSPGTTLIQDVAVTGDVTDPGGLFGGGYVAGLVGLVIADSGDAATLQRVSYAGSLSANSGSRVGGLMGAAFVTGNSAAAAVTIADSYNAGTVTTSDNEVGGILGSAIAIGSGVTSIIDLSRVYNRGAVIGTDGVGGLFGIANSTHSGDAISITDSFSAGAVTATVANGGGLVGANSADPPTILSTTNDFYDGPATGQSVCAGLLAPTGSCTRIDTGSQPSYFKANRTNPPLNNWDFSTIWTTNPGTYPTLIPVSDGDGIALAEEGTAPNLGDANNDGINDAAEANVTSFVDAVDGHYVAVALDPACSNGTVSTAPESSNAVADAGYDYPAGLVSYTSNCATPGFTATVSLYFYGVSSANLVVRKYNPAIHGYSAIPGASLSSATIGGQPAVKATYQITDGGALDEDGTANGVIVDPVGLARNVVGAPNTGGRF